MAPASHVDARSNSCYFCINISLMIANIDIIHGQTCILFEDIIASVTPRLVLHWK